MPRRMFDESSPEVSKWIYSVRFFKSDVDYVESHGKSVSAILREALHAYVVGMQEREALPVMDKAARDTFVLTGRVPEGVKYTPKKDPAVYFKPEPSPRIKITSQTRAGPDMTSWSKHDRDTYILTGQVPA